MGQIFSNLLGWLLFQEARNETSRDDQYQPINNYPKVSTEFVDDKQLRSHFISIPDQVHPIQGSTSDTIENHHQYNFSNQASPPHIVVHLNSRNEDDSKTKEKQKTAIINCDDEIDQVIAEEVYENTVKKKGRRRRKKNNFTNTISRPVPTSVKRIGDYTSTQRILLVGEGDFSFSASLAVAFGSSAFNIIATSLNHQEFLMKNYRMFMSNKAELESRGSLVIHGVNARKMVTHPLLGTLLFDRIIFNFPHTGKFDKSDFELRTNQKLLRGFLGNAKKMIEEDGEIHITSKSTSFYQAWNIPKLGSDHGLYLIQEDKFIRGKYPGYHTKFGFGGDKDFNCNPSKTYKFGLSLP